MTTTRSDRYRADRRAPQHGLTAVVLLAIAALLVVLAVLGLRHLWAEATADFDQLTSSTSTR